MDFLAAYARVQALAKGKKRANQPGYVKAKDKRGRTIWVPERSAAGTAPPVTDGHEAMIAHHQHQIERLKGELAHHHAELERHRRAAGHTTPAMRREQRQQWEDKAIAHDPFMLFAHGGPAHVRAVLGSWPAADLRKLVHTYSALPHDVSDSELLPGLVEHGAAHHRRVHRLAPDTSPEQVWNHVRAAERR